MRNHLAIFLNGHPLSVTGEDAFLTLSEFLRRRQRLTGTKVVCAEGDCGACAVLIGKITVNKIHYSPVNSCIQFMFQLDASHIITVEGLRDSADLNPIQASMVKCHGAQCGFCTPGFTVVLYDLLRHHQPVDRETVRRALVGNLCRCTGYDSIIRAALETDVAAMPALDHLYPPQPIAAELSARAAEEVLIQSTSHCFYKPLTVQQAIQFRSQNPDSLLLSGATDLGVQCNKGTRHLTTVMTLAHLQELQSIRATDDTLHIGAAATLSDLQRTAETHLPELANFLERFGSPPIRNAATLAGNLVNASPIGDPICALLALETELTLAGPTGPRQVRLRDFYTAYRRTILAPTEILTAIHFSLPLPGEIYKLYKISKRRDLDISSVAAAIWMRKEATIISDIRIACAGVAPLVLRLEKTESLLRGRPLCRESFEIAAAAAAQEVTPISDVRGSAEYRRTLAHNILLKFWHDLDDSPSEGAP